MSAQSSASEPGASQNTTSTDHSDQKHKTETSPQPSSIPAHPSNALTSKIKCTSYPPPFIIPPLSTQLQSIIILHGRGSSASAFGPPFLSTPISHSQTQTLRTAFPQAKFIFPTASKRRARIFNRASINQWFDNWSLTTPTEREELQIEGLRESSGYIHSLLREEMEIVGAGNVVLGGLSQGCAASLVALLMWEGEPLGAAFVGSSVLHPSMAFQRTPLFLGHGTEDNKVFLHLGREAASCLRSLGMQVFWTKYEGLAHWYSPAMLRDLVDFLQGLDLGSAPGMKETARGPTESAPR